MTAQTTEAEGKDRGEAGGLPAEDETEHSDGGIAVRLRGGSDEDEAHEQVDGEDVARLDGLEGHHTASQETIEGVEALPRQQRRWIISKR